MQDCKIAIVHHQIAILHGVNLYNASLLRLCCIDAVKLDEVLSLTSKWHEVASRDRKHEHGWASRAPDGIDRGDTGGSQVSGDHAAAMGNVLGAALTCQLRQPQIYKALGMDRPPISITVFEADRWLDSWHVVASSVPSQQAKLSIGRLLQVEVFLLHYWFAGLLCKFVVAALA